MGRPGEKLFPALLRRLRIERNLTARDIAEAIGAVVSEVQRFETGYRPPPPHERLEKIARRLGLTQDERIDLFTAAAIDRGNLDVDGFDRDDVAQIVAFADAMRAQKKAARGRDGEAMSGHEGWAIVEMMGHRRAAGRISETTLAGAPMLRLDVPGDGDAFDPPRFISPQALYQVTMVTEEQARKEAEWSRPRPVRALPWPAKDQDAMQSDPFDDDEEDMPPESIPPSVEPDADDEEEL